MEAYISGTAGLAVMISGTSAELYYVDKVVPVKITSQVARQIINNNKDILIVNDSDKRAVLRKLSRESNKTTALMMLLTFLDSNIENSSKKSISDYLNSLFSNDLYVYDYVCNIIFSRPLPQNSIQAIPSGLIEEDSKLYKLIKLLLESQRKITECRSIFTSLCEELTNVQIEYLEGVLVNLSFFYLFGSGQADSNFLNHVHFSLLKSLKNTDIPNLVGFTSSFKGHFKGLASKVNQSLASIPSKVLESDEVKFEVKERKTNNLETFESVKKQLAAIKIQLRARSLNKAKIMALDLISAQLRSGNNEHAAHSLCQLSEYAKHLKLYSLQLEWALKATEISPLDYRTFGHTADAYMNLEDFNSARIYFEKCLSGTGDNRVYGLTGLARIEKSRYDLNAAMEYIEDAIRECGKDYIPYLIKAEILREQHKYKESEFIYKYVCREYPEHCIPQCGMAAVIADQKRFSEAEDIYRFAIKNYNKNEEQCSTLSALGFLVARLGRFDESYKLLDKSISLAKYENIIPVASKAKVLQMEGRFSESESLLIPLLNKRFSEPAEQLLSLYLQANQLDKAINLYTSLDVTVQSSDVVQIRYSQLLKRQNKFGEALEVIDKLRAAKPVNTSAMNARASIFKEKGEYEQALCQYKEVLKINRYDRVAHFGVESMNHILNRNIGVENIICNADVINPVTIDDYQTLGNMGLLKLAQGEIKEAKLLLQQSCGSNFKGLSFNFSPGLSLASLMLKQNSAALRNIKKPLNVFSYIQKAMVYGESGKKDQVLNILKNITLEPPLFTKKIIEMIELKYVCAANDENISQYDIYQEQLKNILLAA